MRKAKKLVGIVAILLLQFQSTIGIINYVQSDSNHDFSNGKGKLNMRTDGEFGENPPQFSADSNNTTESNSTSASTNTEAQNIQPPNMDRNFNNQLGFSAFSFRNMESGLPGLVINIFSIGVTIAWCILAFLTKRRDKMITP